MQIQPIHTKKTCTEWIDTKKQFLQTKSSHILANIEDGCITLSQSMNINSLKGDTNKKINISTHESKCHFRQRSSKSSSKF